MENKNEDKMNDEPVLLKCPKHGSAERMIACGHLVLGGHGIGIYTPDNDFDNCTEAWCMDCEERLLMYGIDSEIWEKKANLKLICKKCFEIVKRYNRQMYYDENDS